MKRAAETFDWPCGKRLAPFMEEAVAALEADGVVALTDASRTVLPQMSAATTDRLLRQNKREARQRRTRPGYLLKKWVNRCPSRRR